MAGQPDFFDLDERYAALSAGDRLERLAAVIAWVPRPVRQIVTLICAEPPGEGTHWTGRAIARHTGVSLRSVPCMWAAHDLQPHRIRTFKRSSDPEFAAKLEDIVGLYVDPPKHAVVLSVDEKSQIQAPDRTQPGLPPPSCLPEAPCLGPIGKPAVVVVYDPRI
jgi:hypothetical protein